MHIALHHPLKSSVEFSFKDLFANSLRCHIYRSKYLLFTNYRKWVKRWNCVVNTYKILITECYLDVGNLYPCMSLGICNSVVRGQDWNVNITTLLCGTTSRTDGWEINYSTAFADILNHIFSKFTMNT